MISTRGPEDIMVVDRNCVPIADVCTTIISSETVTEVTQKLPVNVEEIFECVNIFADYFGPQENDFIEIECAKDGNDTAVEAVGMSDWVYFGALQMGHALNNREDDFQVLFSMGMEKIMYDCLCDIIEGIDDYSLQGLHQIVFESFSKAYGNIDQKTARRLLGTLSIFDEDNDD